MMLEDCWDHTSTDGADSGQASRVMTEAEKQAKEKATGPHRELIRFVLSHPRRQNWSQEMEVRGRFLATTQRSL